VVKWSRGPVVECEEREHRLEESMGEGIRGRVRAPSLLDNIPRLRLFPAPVPCAVYDRDYLHSVASDVVDYSIAAEQQFADVR
jgi:hypothetical protein